MVLKDLKKVFVLAHTGSVCGKWWMIPVAAIASPLLVALLALDTALGESDSHEFRGLAVLYYILFLLVSPSSNIHQLTCPSSWVWCGADWRYYDVKLKLN